MRVGNRLDDVEAAAAGGSGVRSWTVENVGTGRLLLRRTADVRGLAGVEAGDSTMTSSGWFGLLRLMLMEMFDGGRAAAVVVGCGCGCGCIEFLFGGAEVARGGPVCGVL